MEFKIGKQTEFAEVFLALKYWLERQQEYTTNYEVRVRVVDDSSAFIITVDRSSKTDISF